MKSSIRKKLLVILLISCILVEPIVARRSGGGGHSRGSSAGRSSSAGSRPRTGTNSGGYHHNTGGSSYPRGNYGVGSHSNTNTGHSNTGNSGGGFFNRQSNNRQGNSGGGLFKSSSGNNPRFNKGSGIGSMVRSNTFKNAIVGAAAGYLTYQAGKHLIRSAMSPMMWNNRPYYWGSNYYQQRPGMSMCRMPIQQGDPQFGNIYFNDNTRPREITWGCGYGEVCCGYECCPANNYGGGNYGGGNYGSGGYYRNNSFRNFGFGSLFILILISCCACFVVYRFCNRNSNSYQRAVPQAY